jgi:hypothetical protein
MRWFDKLERRLRRFAVPNVTLFLVICQVLAYGAMFAQEDILERLQFVPGKVLAGEWWRAITFLAIPPITNPLFAFFFWYLFWMMGTALEHHWGAFRYNVFLLVGYVGNVAAALAIAPLAPDMPASNGFLQGSVFLAFAFLYPDFTIQLFFILPVKIKWLALITWAYYFFQFAVGGWLDRMLVAASVLNFLLFFGSDIVRRIGYGRRQMTAQVQKIAERNKPFHVCTVCGITDQTHPQMDFRYCTRCAGGRGYCTEHIQNHEHITAEQDAARK